MLREEKRKRRLIKEEEEQEEYRDLFGQILGIPSKKVKMNETDKG